MRFGRDRPRGATSRRRLGSTLGVNDIAIDLGTANTLVYVGGEGIVVAEPSVVAMDTESGEVHAVGAEAERMIGRTPATISAVRPLRHGVIADFEVTEQMLRYFIARVLDRRWAHPRLIVCAPSGVTEVEQRAVEHAALAAGARRVQLIEEPIAAAIGAGVPIEEPVGRMIVDIGGGTSEVAVISLGGIVLSRSLRVGGYEMDEALGHYMRGAHQLVIGSRTAEAIKLAIGSAHPLAEEMTFAVRGRHIISGLPSEVQLHSEEVREALRAPLREILLAITETLEQTPPELASDIARHGILLAGGGTLLRGLAKLVEEETAIATNVIETALTCVAVGSGLALEHYDRLAGSATAKRARASRSTTTT
ncbi:MAG: Rod shape-determining protein MreB [uncultured Solirubrobacteraceae bacterium]|uniref:Cell shape-determining protein MreB n=1 Tax=uncultured Solirubrobacteraceae bacterium TaxID=1162706 RepID=A0A6J4RTB3_9ACTN|nr:MAG: Rod shape-determining protein MreB [uncultured Solirubrobacteraceae bacterium]